MHLYDNDNLHVLLRVKRLDVNDYGSGNIIYVDYNNKTTIDTIFLGYDEMVGYGRYLCRNKHLINTYKMRNALVTC